MRKSLMLILAILGTALFPAEFYAQSAGVGGSGSSQSSGGSDSTGAANDAGLGASTPAAPQSQTGRGNRSIQTVEARGVSNPVQFQDPGSALSDPRIDAGGDPRAGTGNAVNQFGTDAALRGSILNLVNNFSPAATNVNADVRDGVVTLTGTVSTFAEAQNIATAIRSLAGVTLINNNLLTLDSNDSRVVSGVVTDRFSGGIIAGPSAGNVTSDPRLNVLGSGDPRAGTNTAGSNFNAAGRNLSADQSATAFATANDNPRSNADLQVAVRTALNNFGVPTNSVVVEAQNGVINLSGVVATQEQLNLILSLVRSMNGVVSVNSSLSSVQ